MLSSSLRRWFLAGLIGLPLAACPVAVFAQDVPLRLNIPIKGLTEVSGLPQYISAIYSYAIAISVIAATVMVVYGGFRYLMGASYGDVQRGKEIVINAIAGMMLVFLAYILLRTVNPDTVTLRMPSIARVQKQSFDVTAREFTTEWPFENAKDENGRDIIRRSCALDGQCADSEKTRNQRCIRKGYAHRREQTFFSVDWAALSAGRLETGGWETLPYIDIAADLNEIMGTCTDGGLGARCRTSDEGGALTLPGQPDRDIAFINQLFDREARTQLFNRRTEFGQLAGYVLNTGVDAITGALAGMSSWYERRLDANMVRNITQAYGTNNNWTGTYPCQSNSDCVFRLGTLGEGWYCQNKHQMEMPAEVRTARTSPAPTACTTDVQCNGGSCIRTDSSATAPSGECSTGQLGQRCTCKGYGCSRFQGVAQRIRPCQNNTHCFMYSGSGVGGLTADWFCGPPVSASTTTPTTPTTPSTTPTPAPTPGR